MKLRTLPSLIPTDARGYGRKQRERGRDRDRRAEQPWRAWYHLPIWNHPASGLRAMQLSREPICQTCHSSPATVAHHKIAHCGVWELFVDPTNLESACKACHDGAIQRGERAGNRSSRALLPSKPTDRPPSSTVIRAPLGSSSVPRQVGSASGGLAKGRGLM